MSTVTPAVPARSDFHIWAVRVLHEIGAPVTKANLRFLNAWAHREGTSAKNNPLATTQPEHGSTSFNSVGVQNYPTLNLGAKATAATLENGYYDDVLKALRTGHISTKTHFSGLKTWSGNAYDNLAGEPTSGNAGSFGASSLPTSITDVPAFLGKHLALVGLIIILVVVIASRKK